jgi:hypothetical protein
MTLENKVPLTMIGVLTAALLGMFICSYHPKKEEYNIAGQKVVFSTKGVLDLAYNKISLGDSFDIRADLSDNVKAVRKGNTIINFDGMYGISKSDKFFGSVKREEVYKRELSEAQKFYNLWKSRIDSARQFKVDSLYDIIH